MSHLLITSSAFLPILAQADEGYGSIFLWLGVLIVLLVAGFFGVSWVRRWLKEDDAAPAAAAGFTLSDLRDLRRSGQISEEEFQRAKEKIVAAAQRAAEREAERQANAAGRRPGLKRDG